MSIVNTDPPSSTALEIIDSRLQHVVSDAEIMIWLSIRKDVIAQDNILVEAEHRRSVEKREATVKLAHSLLAIPVGLVLLWHNSPFFPGSITPGLALLGAGFYTLALNIVKAFIKDK